MKPQKFRSMEEATSYLNSSWFRYPSEITYFDGKAVLKLFRLSKSESIRYRRVDRKYGRASTKDIVVKAAKSYGIDALNTLKNAKTGNIIGAATSYFKMISKAGSSYSSEDEEQLASRNDDFQAFHKLERAFMGRQLEVYPYVRETFRDRVPRVASRMIKTENDQIVFMFKI